MGVVFQPIVCWAPDPRTCMAFTLNYSNGQYHNACATL